MWKKGSLIFCILMTLVCLSGYFYLTEKVASGRLKIAAGKKQLQDGQQMLAQGKARLAEGKGSLSQAKDTYHDVRSIPFMGIVRHLPVTGAVFSMAHGKIDEGNQLVAKGEEKIKNGEKQLSDGEQDLKKGEKRLENANVIRYVCGLGTALFFVLSVLLGCRCRKR